MDASSTLGGGHSPRRGDEMIGGVTSYTLLATTVSEQNIRACRPEQQVAVLSPSMSYALLSAPTAFPPVAEIKQGVCCVLAMSASDIPPPPCNRNGMKRLGRYSGEKQTRHHSECSLMPLRGRAYKPAFRYLYEVRRMVNDDYIPGLECRA